LLVRSQFFSATTICSHDTGNGVYELAGIGEQATVDRLLQDLGVEERLDALIDNYLERLFLRGLKSLRPLSSSAPLQPAPATPRIPSPNKVR
jgi:hypothetical protein